ncbi:MAG: CAP domain-containing protein [Mycobacteriales bacterium]|nr:CAP domain-containing protein [Frankia sp.]
MRRHLLHVLTLTAIATATLLAGSASASAAAPRGGLCFLRCRVPVTTTVTVPEVPVVPDPVVTTPALPPAPKPVVTAPKPPTVSTLTASGVLRLVNAERARRGVAPLRWDSALATIAARHTAAMAASGNLYHNDSLFTTAMHRALGISFFGENVAEASSPLEAHQAFMTSPHHYANMVNSRFVLVGIAIRHNAAGRYWMTEDFGSARRGGVRVTLPRAAGTTNHAQRRRAASGPTSNGGSRATVGAATAMARPAAAASTHEPVVATKHNASPYPVAVAEARRTVEGALDPAAHLATNAAVELLAGLVLALVLPLGLALVASRTLAGGSNLR